MPYFALLSFCKLLTRLPLDSALTVQIVKTSNPICVSNVAPCGCHLHDPMFNMCLLLRFSSHPESVTISTSLSMDTISECEVHII